MLHSMDFEALGQDDANYTFQVEALDYEGILPPGMATVTVKITVRQLAVLNMVQTLNLLHWLPLHQYVDRISSDSSLAILAVSS